MSKRLSVVTANYNHAKFLQARANSILQQLGPDDEYIIIDDGSQDNSVAIIERLAQADNRIVFIKNFQNQGVIFSINKALQQAAGLYICFLSADDYLLEGFISETMAMLESNPDIGVACSDCAMCNGDDEMLTPQKVYTTHLLPGQTTCQVVSPKQMVNYVRYSTFWVPGHTAVLKTELLQEFGGFDSRLGPYVDWVLFHAVAFSSGVGYIPKNLAVWRQDSTSYSGNGEDPQRYKNELEIFKVLNTPRFQKVRSAFIHSGLVRVFARKRWYYLVLDVKYWDILFFSALIILSNQAKLFGASVLRFFRGITERYV